MTDKPFAGNNMMCGILVYYSLTCEGLSNEFHSLMSDFFVGDWLGSKEEFRWSDIVIAHSQHQQPESKIRGAVRDYALPWHHLKHIRECLNTQEEFKGLKLTATLKWRNLEWNKKSRQLCWILHSACSLHTGVKEVKWTLFFPADYRGSCLCLPALVSLLWHSQKGQMQYHRLSFSLVTARARGWEGMGIVTHFEMQKHKIRAPEGDVCLHYLQLVKDSSL